MNTLFDKIWDAHIVTQVEDGPTQLYIDRLYCHEVTSPQAFDGLRARGIKVLRPEKVFCMPDHNTPTHDQDKPIEDAVSKAQVDALARNAHEFGLTHYGMMHPRNDHRLRRLAPIYPRSHGSHCIRHRNQRGGNGTGFTMHPSGKAQDNAHHSRR